MRWRGDLAAGWGDLAAGWAAQSCILCCCWCRSQNKWCRFMSSSPPLLTPSARLSLTLLISVSKLLLLIRPPPPIRRAYHLLVPLLGCRPSSIRLLVPVTRARAAPPEATSHRLFALLPSSGRWRRFAAVPPPLDSLRPPFLPLGVGSPTETLRWNTSQLFVFDPLFGVLFFSTSRCAHPQEQ